MLSLIVNSKRGRWQLLHKCMERDCRLSPGFRGIMEIVVYNTDRGEPPEAHGDLVPASIFHQWRTFDVRVKTRWVQREVDTSG
jgi:hypothetical protein